ncbi:hypothetical protein COU95_03405 [Candidatus Shapirobacteria bacterium CG10_big_fil_rev_8_21_14_0_10_40_9]|uniref:Mur ligase central domain-containing protein n=1 Tax=Candidatus Shapirobacteria bacterium CG10_big_fil_rev_8_21_14_0_10_40_9 TaxID=1974888 RepID=A0A2M8L2X8_9BACT|nr:MAG: hypothetical protein COU95_03405 [Candidatus Shapirobacteria bacterium CG10_big_fil_rev_8_21_14_0_10_40_9]
MLESIFGPRWHRKILHKSRRQIAKAWLKLNPKVTLIGVTGSFGKTNTVRAISQVLSEKYKTLQTDLNLDTIYNLPITILKLRPWHQKLVLEYGIDKIGEMDFHLGLVKPKIGVLTGISPVHADKEHLGSLENILKEKIKLLVAIPKDGWAILNWDDENIRKAKIKTQAKILKYGISKEADFWAENIKVDLSGTSFVVHHDRKKIPLKIPLLGKHFVHSALVSFAVGKICGLSPKQIITGLKKLKPLEGRMSLEKGPLGAILLDDHLRANLASTIAGLETFSALPCRARLTARQGRKIAVLGEMGEMGRYDKEGHRQVGQEIAKLKIDFLVSVGPLQKETAREAIAGGMKKENVFWVKDVKEAAEVLRKIVKKGDFIYLKGSLLRHLERILLILEDKRVKCTLVSCHNYGQCQTCPNLM